MLRSGNAYAKVNSLHTGSSEGANSGIGGSPPHTRAIRRRSAPTCPQHKKEQHNEHLSDTGGDRAAILYTLIETAKLNGLDPEAYLTHAIRQLAQGHLASRLSELLPWNCKDALAAKVA